MKVSMLPTLAVRAAAPWLVYMLLRPHVSSDAEALAIGGCIPAAWIIARLAVTHTIDRIALASVTVLAVTVAVSILSGGSSLPIKLRYSVVTGAMGLACIGSVVLGRPLPLALAGLRSGGDAAQRDRLVQAFRDPVRRRRLTVATVLIGATLLIDAMVRAILAVSLSTVTYLVVSRAASWAIVGTGVVCAAISLRHGWSRARSVPQDDGVDEVRHGT
jgi:hypothetical protein